MAEVDLERLAEAYVFRLDRAAPTRVAIMLESAQIDRSSLVVDVGGGRGAQAAMCAAKGIEVLVVDPSPGMIQHAVSKRLMAVVGVGEALPLGSAMSDLVYFHLSIHHGDWQAMLDEAWRVVRPGGVVWVWTMADDHHRSSYLARWFPSVEAIDRQRFPAVADLAGHLAALGGGPEVIEHREVVERLAEDFVAAVEAGYVSTLHLVSPQEIEEGLARFRREHPGRSEMVTYQLGFAAVSARRPST